MAPDQAAPDSIRVTLPDGKDLTFPVGSTPRDVAQAIGPGLAKAALAAQIDGHLVDLSRPLDRDVRIRLITERDPEALPLLRHSTAHLLATAVRDSLVCFIAAHSTADSAPPER